MKKRKQIPDKTENNQDPFEDTQIYRAGQEADEKLIEDEDDVHTNGGIPDDIDDDDDEENDDDDDERA